VDAASHSIPALAVQLAQMAIKRDSGPFEHHLSLTPVNTEK